MEPDHLESVFIELPAELEATANEAALRDGVSLARFMIEAVIERIASLKSDDAETVCQSSLPPAGPAAAD